MIVEQIEKQIKELRDLKPVERINQYNLIASGLYSYFSKTNQKKFNREFILSFFETGFYRREMERKHINGILNALLISGFIVEDNINKTSLQRRIYQLKSKDENSYFAILKNNGFKGVNYFVFEQDSDGIPRKKKIGFSNINGLPVDKNGEPVENWDFSELVGGYPRKKQGVYSFGSKSISNEKRNYKIKGYRVV